MDLEDNEFLKFVKAAGENNLEYLLIGGLALAMHGIQRYTSHADVWIQPTNDNKENLINTLLSLGYELGDIQYLKELNFEEAQIVRLEGPIDILTRVHLRESKILARRPKDLNDVLMIDQLIEESSKDSDEI